MVAITVHLSIFEWPFHSGYQTVGYVRAVLQPGC
jgi:hypothetical protein